MKKIKNYLFDWDGTLLNSNDAHEKSFIKTLEDLSPELVGSFNYKEFMGMKSADVFNKIGVADSVDVFSKHKQAIYSRMLASGEVMLFAGVKELLGKIRKDANSQIFIVSGASFESLFLGLEINNLGQYISGVVCGDDVLRSKPDPESYELCLTKYNLDKKQCCAIEDSLGGVQSARGANLIVYGINDSSVKSVADQWFSSIDSFEFFLNS